MSITSFLNFILNPAGSIADTNRNGSVVIEMKKIAFTVASNVAEAEVPTALGEVIGVQGLGIMSTFDTGDLASAMVSDGVITDGKVTVRFGTTSIADGTLTMPVFVYGYAKETPISLG